MPDTFVRSRCVACEKVLSFDDFSLGGSRCRACLKIVKRKPAQQFVRGPGVELRPAATAYDPGFESYERMLDSVPDELIDELVAALEAEAARTPLERGPVREVLDDLGVGRTAREKHWAAWGFAAGFGANVAIAKYAQMATGAPFAQFIGPLLLGGVVAGVCCAAIGWGAAKLREPA